MNIYFKVLTGVSAFALAGAGYKLKQLMTLNGIKNAMASEGEKIIVDVNKDIDDMTQTVADVTVAVNISEKK